MPDGKRLTRRAALGLVTGGGALLAVDTLGFSRLEGNRGVAVSTAADENALLALVEAAYDEIPTNGFETVAYLRNNLSEDVDVDYTVTTNYPDGVTVSFDGQTGGTVSGTALTIVDEAAIDLECSTPGQIGDDERLLVTVSEARTPGVTIRDVEMELPFVCDGAILEITDVRGLGNAHPDHQYEAEVDVAETDNESTENLEVRLVVVGDSGGTVYDATRSPGEIQDEEITVSFDDVGQLPADDYEYTVTADADNASSKSASDTFVVADDLPPDLRVTSTATVSGSNHTITFGLVNDGDRTAVVEALSIDDATHDTQTIDHIERDGNEFERTDGDGALDQQLEVPSAETSLDETAGLDPGEEGAFELGAFRRSAGSPVNMSGASVELTLSLDGEPDQQLVLEP